MLTTHDATNIDMCMKGTICTNQKCYICGGILKYVEQSSLLRCEKHAEVTWHKNCMVRFGRDHTKRFKFVAQAERHLNGLRFETDKGTFDVRDYQSDRPLYLKNLISEFLDFKSGKNIVKAYLRHNELVLNLFLKKTGDVNAKTITENHIDAFLFDKDLDISDKTRACYKSVLTSFWLWLVRKERKRSNIEMLNFPTISYELSWRNITNIETQQKILDEIYRISFHVNPRIWLGVELLACYPKVRPKEMRNLKEGHINLNEKWILFPHPKEKKPKFIHLSDDHAQLISDIRGPQGLPETYFFRHLHTHAGILKGERFGQKLFQTYWNKACKNLDIKGVTLYPGTKHTTVTALGKSLTPEQIKRGATGHTSKAFERYMLPDYNEAKIINEKIKKQRGKTDPHVIHLFEGPEKAK